MSVYGVKTLAAWVVMGGASALVVVYIGLALAGVWWR